MFFHGPNPKAFSLTLRLSTLWNSYDIPWSCTRVLSRTTSHSRSSRSKCNHSGFIFQDGATSSMVYRTFASLRDWRYTPPAPRLSLSTMGSTTSGLPVSMTRPLQQRLRALWIQVRNLDYLFSPPVSELWVISYLVISSTMYPPLMHRAFRSSRLLVSSSRLQLAQPHQRRHFRVHLCLESLLSRLSFFPCPPVQVHLPRSHVFLVS